MMLASCLINPFSRCSTLVVDVPFDLRPPELLRVTVADAVARRIYLPLLLIEQNGEVAILTEAFNWVTTPAMTASYANSRDGCTTVARFLEFWGHFDFNLADPGDLDAIVWGYLYHRIHNPPAIEDRRFPHWKPVSYENIVKELRYLQNFARSSRSSPTFRSVFTGATELFDRAIPNLPEGRFLAHLDANYKRWHEMVDDTFVLPKSLIKDAKRRNRSGKSSTTTLSIDQIESIIDSETNLFYRALWILLAYYGLRICEALHLWLCDILPGSYGRKFTHYDTGDEPFVVVAHPEASTYTGSFSQFGLDRETYLRKQFGRNSRISAEIFGEIVGFKGVMIFDKKRHLSWGYWIDKKRGLEFGELARQIQNEHAASDNSRQHPYFFMNGVNQEFRGMPLRYQNAEAALHRALARAGIPADHPGAHIHGLRHFYKWYAEYVLNIKKETRQIMLRHNHIDSQDDYGKRFQNISNSITAAMKGA